MGQAEANAQMWEEFSDVFSLIQEDSGEPSWGKQHFTNTVYSDVRCCGSYPVIRMRNKLFEDLLNLTKMLFMEKVKFGDLVAQSITRDGVIEVLKKLKSFVAGGFWH